MSLPTADCSFCPLTDKRLVASGVQSHHSYSEDESYSMCGDVDGLFGSIEIITGRGKTKGKASLSKEVARNTIRRCQCNPIIVEKFRNNNPQAV